MVLENLSHHATRLDELLEENSSSSPSSWLEHQPDWIHVLASLDCIDFVATKMQDYPDDDILQRNACGYLQNIGYFFSTHDKLYQRGIPYLSERGIVNFCYFNARLASQARETLYMIDNLYRQRGAVE